MRLNFLFPSLFCLFVLSSCVQVFPPAKKVDTLLLTADFIKDINLKDLPSVPWQLVITEPSVNAYLDKKLVMIEDQSGTVRYLSNIQWPDRLSEFLQFLLVDAFTATHKFKGLSDSALRLSPERSLQLDFNKFHLLNKEDNTYEVVLEASAQLINFKTRKAIKTHSFNVSVPLKETTLLSMHKAFTELLKKFTADLLPWVLNP